MKTSKITYALVTIWIIVTTMLAGCTVVEGPFGTSENGNQAGLDSGSLKVIFLDVGQGASQLIITPKGKTMLIDAGNNDKEQVMLDYLEKYGVNKLDVVIGTHPDADHIGGLDKVIENVPVKQLYMPKKQSNTKTFESVLQAVKKRNLKITTAKAGLEWDLDEQVHVKMLAPNRSYDDTNNMSAVVKLTYGQTSYLLTGDAESESEKDMLQSGADLRADVMLVGHHGSKSSTTLKFLQKVNPKYAVIQVGAGNTYGHPKKEILNRLEKQGVKVYRNDLNGTVVTESDGTHISIHADKG